MNAWRKWHKWLGIVIGLQILLWISGGVVMSAIPIEIVRGKHLVTATEPNSAPLETSVERINVTQWKSLSWIKRGGQDYILATDWHDTRQLLDPRTGLVLGRFTPDQVSDIAVQRYQGKGNLVAVSLLDTSPAEVAFLKSPLYQVRFDDWINTHLYIDPDTGEILRVRSDIWRLYDVFWMLHIMDYDGRSDFNNPLLITAALVALAMVFSGLVMTYFVWLRPRARKLVYYMRK